MGVGGWVLEIVLETDEETIGIGGGSSLLGGFIIRADSVAMGTFRKMYICRRKRKRKYIGAERSVTGARCVTSKFININI